MRSMLPVVGNGASDPTNVGRGNASRRSSTASSVSAPGHHRMSAPSAMSEQRLLTVLEQTYHQSNLNIPRSLITAYYVALKSGVFVTLVGKAGAGKVDFAQLFAHTMVGSNHTQHVVISGDTRWFVGTGEGAYYRSVNDRFASMRFLEVLQEAALPINAQKLYFVCFQRLNPDVIEHFLTNVVSIDHSGTKRLRIPGAAAEQQPIIPPNVCMTATVDTPHNLTALKYPALRQAALVNFSSSAYQARQQLLNPGLPPSLPVGYQRIWTSAVVSDLTVARKRMRQLLGDDTFSRLQVSPAIRPLFWKNGDMLYGQHRKELTLVLANSFDASGIGLFHPEPQRNAQLAYDVYVIQRVLWQLQDNESSIYHDLVSYIEHCVQPRMAVA